jgi:hypothetical protein
MIQGDKVFIKEKGSLGIIKSKIEWNFEGKYDFLKGIYLIQMNDGSELFCQPDDLELNIRKIIDLL